MKLNVIRILEEFSNLIDEALIINLKLHDFDMDSYKFTQNHQFKIAHFSILLGELLHLSKNELEDLYILGLLHDTGFVSSEITPENKNVNILKSYEALVGHCIVGEKLISDIPFNTDVKDVITYHHELYNGTGFFRMSGENIPLFSRILLIANLIDIHFNLSSINEKYDEICNYVFSESGTSMDPLLIQPTLQVLKLHRNTNFSLKSENTPVKRIEMNWNEILQLLETLMKITDQKSPFTFQHSKSIASLIDSFSYLYNFNSMKKDKLHIAANIHDVGKLQIPLSILEKPAILTGDEMDMIMRHPSIAEAMFQDIEGFEEIAVWVGQHHEKLNGKGYPKGLVGDEILFESRILAICDIFVALTEERPYRRAFERVEAIKMMKEMVVRGELDSIIFIDLLTILNE